MPTPTPAPTPTRSHASLPDHDVRNRQPTAARLRITTVAVHPVTRAESVAQLRTIAATAEALTALLDGLRPGYLPSLFHGPDPVNVALEQAAAAAHDLSTSTRHAIEILGGHSLHPSRQDP